MAKLYQNYHKTRFNKDPIRDKVWKIITKYLQKKYIPKGRVILDIGCGYGNFINNCVAKEKHAIDLSNDLKKFLKKEVNFKSISTTKLLDIYKKNYFDIIFASNIFEHLSDDEFNLTIHSIKKILKPGGKLIILQPNFKYSYKEYFDDYTHKLIFTHIGMEDRLKNDDFKLIKSFPKFLPYSMKNSNKYLYLLLYIYLISPIKPLGKQMLLIFKNE